MKMEEGDETDGLESQRQALADMSQALLGRLNAMVAEQEQRAREFAARAHSLSALPEFFEQEKAEQTGAAPQGRPERVVAQAPPLVRSADRPAVTPTSGQEYPALPREVKRKEAKTAPPETSENSIGVGKLIFIGAVIYMMLRSCS